MTKELVLEENGLYGVHLEVGKDDRGNDVISFYESYPTNASIHNTDRVDINLNYIDSVIKFLEQVKSEIK